MKDTGRMARSTHEIFDRRGVLLALFVTICVLVAGFAAQAEDTGRVLFEDGYEQKPDIRVQIHDANQPYERHELGLSPEMAHGGAHGAKSALTSHHGISA